MCFRRQLFNYRDWYHHGGTYRYFLGVDVYWCFHDDCVSSQQARLDRRVIADLILAAATMMRSKTPMMVSRTTNSL